nr:MAG TPA: hypothetical protein [Caudoviricetes sp.]
MYDYIRHISCYRRYIAILTIFYGVYCCRLKTIHTIDI